MYNQKFEIQNQSLIYDSITISIVGGDLTITSKYFNVTYNGKVFTITKKPEVRWLTCSPRVTHQYHYFFKYLMIKFKTKLPYYEMLMPVLLANINLYRPIGDRKLIRYIKRDNVFKPSLQSIDNYKQVFKQGFESIIYEQVIG